MRCSRRLVTAGLALLALPGCQREQAAQADDAMLEPDLPPPEFVYVRTPEVRVQVEVRAERDHAPVDTWIRLHATRRISGTWRRQRYAELSPDTLFLSQQPPPFEAEVAANLRWLVDPPDGARMNVPGLQDMRLLERQIRFERPGVYRVSARSHVPIDGESNVLILTIH